MPNGKAYCGAFVNKSPRGKVRFAFRQTLLENPAVPDAVGSTSTFDGRTSTSRDARHGVTRVTPYQPDELTVPAEWLVPGRIAYLLTQPVVHPGQGAVASHHRFAGQA